MRRIQFCTLFLIWIVSSQAFIMHPIVSKPSRPSRRRNFEVVKEQKPNQRATTGSMAAVPDSTAVAQSLGLLIGVFSLVLYTPIAVRLLRQKSADGLVTSTWWLKLSSYTASDIYGFTHGYPVSTYIETLIITVEAATILGLVVYYQNRADKTFWLLALAFVTTVFYLLNAAPPQVIALGQGAATILNIGALIPQFLLNNERQKAGDYSPITAGLAALGCMARIFTTIQLAGSDGLLLASFGIAFVFNSALFAQIIYLGTQVERRTLFDVLTADVGVATRTESELQETEMQQVEPMIR